MSRIKLAVLFLSFSGLCFSQVEESSVSQEERQFTVLAGFGNSMGWLGIQGEWYFRGDRFSVFGGLGYMPSLDKYPTGATFAAGARAFTGGEKHRAFLELSVSQIKVKEITVPNDPNSGRRAYGPGVQVGYQFTAHKSLTFMASIGLG